MVMLYNMFTILTAGNTDFLNPLRVLINLLLSAVALVGIIMIIKNLSELLTAWKSNDESGTSSAAKGLIGGILMAGIGGLLTFLGITW
ncbi:MAG: hypothetical protein J6B50_11860 [Lachnospiraceae bacterium]|nr:hypothetical protein [Lachnospiraceae bacterium]